MIEQSKEEIKNLYDSGKSAKEISLKFGTSRPTIISILKSMGVEIRVSHRTDLKDKEVTKKIKELYSNGKSTIEISKEFNTSHTTINRILKSEGINRRTKKEALKKYSRINTCVICGTNFRPRENYKDTKNLTRKTCSKECLSKLLSSYKNGEKSYTWKGGFSQSYYQKIRNGFNINYCEKCGKEGRRLDTHHIDRNRSNNERSNILVLCVNCHSYLHYLEDDRGLQGWKGKINNNTS